MIKREYQHRRDEIDGLVQALGKLERAEGTAAARAAVPKALHPAIRELERLEKVGFILATEIALRTALKVEAMT